MKKSLCLAAIIACVAPLAHALPLLYVHDASGNLGLVDVATGSSTVIGSMGVQMTDVAFDSSGNLYGMTFSGLYSINATTAAATFIGNHGIAGGNALVFSSGGTLYGAGNSTTGLFSINPASGASTNLGNIGFSSAGDLAFNGGNLYLASTSNQLVQIDLSGPVSGTAIGAFGYSDVFGLATADDGVLYGVSNTTIFSVNTATGAGTFISNYGGHGLGASYGSSFYTEAGAPPPGVPEGGSSLALFTSALIALGLIRRGKRSLA